MDLHLVVRHVDGDVGPVEKIVRKALFDRVALLTKANDKIVDAVSRKDLKDVPEDRFPTDLYHRLRF